MNNIIVYSTSFCPSCDDIKRRLDSAGINYTSNSNVQEMKQLGFKEVPVVKINENFYSYKETLKLIENGEIKKDIEVVDGRKLMSNAKFFEGYSRYNEDKGAYETWDEAVHRVMNMHRKFYKQVIKQNPGLEKLMKEVESVYKDKLILGAQRALQFGGDQLLKKHARLYNCYGGYCDRPNFFGGLLFLLLAGGGVGFSIQKHHIAKLPNIEKRVKTTKTFVVPDSIEGWAQSVDVLLSSYFLDGGVYPEYKGRKVRFDLLRIRPEGSAISGGFKAPGPEPLRKALNAIEEKIEKELEKGETRLKSIVLYDICMFIADAVLSGGVRRSATICVFSKDDEDMLKAKHGNWYDENPQRARSNNSVMLLRDSTTFEEFKNIIEVTKSFGEPGFIWSDDLEFIYNPCCEVGMLAVNEKGESGWQACNLTEINGVKTTKKEIFFKQCKYASILGTLQAGYTAFPFLRDATEAIIRREALIGVGITGMMNNPHILFDEETVRKGARIVKKWNKLIAKIIGINQAARTTVIKPSGNSSVLLECSSGIHGEHSNKYLRNVKFNKNTEVAKLLMQTNPNMCAPADKPTDITVSFPIKVPENSIFTTDLLGVKHLDYIKKTQQNWIEEGKNIELCVDPRLSHNVSNTVTVDDWDAVTKYIYKNKHCLCGVSLAAASGDKVYRQAPLREVVEFQDIVSKYGEVSLFTSALIMAGLAAFNNDMWLACDIALQESPEFTDSSEDLLKRDFVRKFNKFSAHFKSKEDCIDCLKSVYILHKYWKINNTIKPINWSTDLGKKEFVEINTTGASGCSGGKCDIEW